MPFPIDDHIMIQAVRVTNVGKKKNERTVCAYNRIINFLKEQKNTHAYTNANYHAHLLTLGLARFTQCMQLELCEIWILCPNPIFLLGSKCRNEQNTIYPQEKLQRGRPCRIVRAIQNLVPMFRRLCWQWLLIVCEWKVWYFGSFKVFFS